MNVRSPILQLSGIIDVSVRTVEFINYAANIIFLNCFPNLVLKLGMCSASECAQLQGVYVCAHVERVKKSYSQVHTNNIRHPHLLLPLLYKPIVDESPNVWFNYSHNAYV